MLFLWKIHTERQENYTVAHNSSLTGVDLSILNIKTHELSDIDISSPCVYVSQMISDRHRYGKIILTVAPAIRKRESDLWHIPFLERPTFLLWKMLHAFRGRSALGRRFALRTLYYAKGLNADQVPERPQVGIMVIPVNFWKSQDGMAGTLTTGQFQGVAGIGHNHPRRKGAAVALPRPDRKY